MHCSTQNPIFTFLKSNFRYQHNMSFKIALALFQLFFTLYDVGMRFDNVSVILNFVAAAYVHLATSSVTITCRYVYSAKRETLMRLM